MDTCVSGLYRMDVLVLSIVEGADASIAVALSDIQSERLSLDGPITIAAGIIICELYRRDGVFTGFTCDKQIVVDHITLYATL